MSCGTSETCCVEAAKALAVQIWEFLEGHSEPRRRLHQKKGRGKELGLEAELMETIERITLGDRVKALPKTRFDAR